MNGSVIINCDCNCPSQDELHGKNRRVANYKGGADSNNVKCSCTCCGKEHSSAKTTKTPSSTKTVKK